MLLYGFHHFIHKLFVQLAGIVRIFRWSIHGQHRIAKMLPVLEDIPYPDFQDREVERFNYIIIRPGFESEYDILPFTQSRQ